MKLPEITLSKNAMLRLACTTMYPDDLRRGRFFIGDFLNRNKYSPKTVEGCPSMRKPKRQYD